MSWFDRYADGDVDAGLARLDAAVARARLVELLDSAAGPRGLRRFLVRLELRAGARARVTGMESAPLPGGGGPPTPARFDAGARALEAACASLRPALGARGTFSRAVLGFVRDGAGARHVAVRLDEDADGFTLADLPVPRGEGWPPEDPAYVRALAAWETRMASVRERWAVAADGEAWSLEGGRLERPGAPPVRVAPIATLDGEQFTWLLEQPAGEEAPLATPSLEAPLPVAVELVLLAAARLGHKGAFQGRTEDGAVIFAGLP
jgi:hypothetical protein